MPTIHNTTLKKRCKHRTSVKTWFSVKTRLFISLVLSILSLAHTRTSPLSLLSTLFIILFLLIVTPLMGTKFPSHQLNNGLNVSGRPEQPTKKRASTMLSRADPYIGGDDANWGRYLVYLFLGLGRVWVGGRVNTTRLGSRVRWCMDRPWLAWRKKGSLVLRCWTRQCGCSWWWCWWD